MKRVYIDTSILVFFFIRTFDASFSKMAKDFLTKVESGQYEGVISLFVLMELVKQLRELLVKANVCMKADWETAVKTAFEAIYKMQNMKIIEGTVAEKGQSDSCSLLTHSEVAWDSFNIMNKYCGSVKLKNGGFVHDGIHPVDAVHVALAKKTGCSMIATLDRDFKETDNEVKSLILLDDPF